MKQQETPASTRFPRSLRLLKHADFQAVYQQGKKQFSSNMIAFYRDRGEGGGPRVGLTVGKVLGGAVQRNRIRRRMRAAVQHRCHQLTRPVDVVLHPRKSVLELDFTSLEAEIGKLFSLFEKGRQR